MSAKDAVIEFVRALPDQLTPADIVAELDSRFGAPGREIPVEVAEAAWAPVINRRVEELRSGRVVGIPAEHVFPELNEPDE
ncbi:MAG: hypothetical protein ACRC7O_00690 [Fimbriiglobus sp.]